MLVLTRKKNEQIVINEDVVITVLSIHSGQVRLGIRAPQDVRVLRQEIVSRSPRPARDLTSPKPKMT